MDKIIYKDKQVLAQSSQQMNSLIKQSIDEEEDGEKNGLTSAAPYTSSWFAVFLKNVAGTEETENPKRNNQRGGQDQIEENKTEHCKATLLLGKTNVTQRHSFPFVSFIGFVSSFQSTSISTRLPSADALSDSVWVVSDDKFIAFRCLQLRSVRLIHLVSVALQCDSLLKKHMTVHFKTLLLFRLPFH